MEAPTKAEEKAAPDTSKFRVWVESERANGLDDLKFYCLPTDSATVESVCKEINEIISSEVVPDDEFF